ncbi:MAG: MFS transporter [Parachlamydiales bacterium]|jgi:MFS family permease
MQKANFKKWLMVLAGAFFFFYSLVQVNLMTALNHELLKSFQASSAQIAWLGASSFYANMLFILPAGLLLDRFSVKKLMLFNMALAVLGTLVFALAPALWLAALGRFLAGIMMAFGLVACLKLAFFLLPTEKLALASSLIFTIGFLGGVAAQVPLAFLTARFGWRPAVLAVAVLGIVVASLIFWAVQDPRIAKDDLAERLSFFDSLRLVFKKPQNWLGGFFICQVNLPLALFGALFGIMYLSDVFYLDRLTAAGVVSMLFLGVIAGAPVFGFLSDFFQRRKPVMFLGALGCLAALLVLLFSLHLSLFSLYLLFFLIGFFSGSQVLGYPLIAESNPAKLSATASGLAVLIVVGLGYGAGLPLVGALLDGASSQPNCAFGLCRTYSAAAFLRAFLVLPIGLMASLVSIFFMKETRCRSLF